VVRGRAGLEQEGELAAGLAAGQDDIGGAQVAHRQQLAGRRLARRVLMLCG